MNKIILEFDKSISGLAGNDYGVAEYKKQVQSCILWNDKNEIIFPDNIKKVGISFIQGFFSEILEKIDKGSIDNYIIIKSSSDDLSKKIVENIKF